MSMEQFMHQTFMEQKRTDLLVPLSEKIPRDILSEDLTKEQDFGFPQPEPKIYRASHGGVQPLKLPEQEQPKQLPLF